MSKPSKKLIAEGFFEFKKNAGEGLCWVKNCARERKPDRCLCAKHTMERWRQKNQQSAAYRTLRDHAKARRIAFTITPEYFNGLTDGMAYFKAKDGEVPSIDRIDASKGYEPGNLRVISVSENSIKSHKERYLPEHVQDMLRREHEKMLEQYAHYLEDDEEDNCPF